MVLKTFDSFAQLADARNGTYGLCVDFAGDVSYIAAYVWARGKGQRMIDLDWRSHRAVDLMPAARRQLENLISDTLVSLVSKTQANAALPSISPCSMSIVLPHGAERQILEIVAQFVSQPQYFSPVEGIGANSTSAIG